LSGKSKWSEKSDVYSFAITCWEIYTKGETPYPNCITNREAVEWIKQGLRMEISSSWPKIVKRIIDECWAQQPSQRPTFQEIHKRLEKKVGASSHQLLVIEPEIEMKEVPSSQSKSVLNESNYMKSVVFPEEPNYMNESSATKKKPISEVASKTVVFPDESYYMNEPSAKKKKKKPISKVASKTVVFPEESYYMNEPSAKKKSISKAEPKNVVYD
jgi:hypothetical protein